VEDAECEFLDVFLFSLLAWAEGWERGWEGNRKIKEMEWRGEDVEDEVVVAE
jgi:hypothetical protein